jgi:hypothetical protein
MEAAVVMIAANAFSIAVIAEPLNFWMDNILFISSLDQHKAGGAV